MPVITIPRIVVLLHRPQSPKFVLIIYVSAGQQTVPWIIVGDLPVDNAGICVPPSVQDHSDADNVIHRVRHKQSLHNREPPSHLLWGTHITYLLCHMLDVAYILAGV